MKNKHLGSTFDNLLEEEGLRADTEAVAIKRVIAYQIEMEMKRAKLSKSALAERMHTSRSALDRLLDPSCLRYSTNTGKGCPCIGKEFKNRNGLTR